MSAADAGVRIERVGSVAAITLDRPKALNALNLPMVRVLSDAYAASAGDAAVTSIVMSGAGGKAFCAGGDVRAVMEAARVDPTGLSDAFFREEYALNASNWTCAMSNKSDFIEVNGTMVPNNCSAPPYSGPTSEFAIHWHGPPEQ